MALPASGAGGGGDSVGYPASGGGGGHGGGGWANAICSVKAPAVSSQSGANRREVEIGHVFTTNWTANQYEGLHLTRIAESRPFARVASTGAQTTNSAAPAPNMAMIVRKTTTRFSPELGCLFMRFESVATR